MLAEARDDFEERHGLNYCRRCGRCIVNDRFPDKVVTADCQVVKISLR